MAFVCAQPVKTLENWCAEGYANMRRLAGGRNASFFLTRVLAQPEPRRRADAIYGYSPCPESENRAELFSVRYTRNLVSNRDTGFRWCVSLQISSFTPN